ncbi:MAG: succinyl-diaminopimelate desuccinylase [Chloroflexota bacterium]|nr:succinyl-diaminopimelate desuccinylase [Chloroflexota bacterium]
MSEIDKKSLMVLCRDLIRIDSTNPPGNERKAAQFVADRLQRIGFETEMIAHTPERASLMAVLQGRPDADNFTFVGHLDTVPCGDLSLWEHDPFEGYCDGQRIIGRGASDMKGGLAALLGAAESLKDKAVKNTIILAFTADEESGCLGSTALLEFPLVRKSSLLLVPEPTSNHIGVAEKGALWVRLHARGKSAHGSMPDQGVNAIEEILALMRALDLSAFQQEQNDYLGRFTASLNTISGGIKTNIIPDRCEVTLDIRTLPSQDHGLVLAIIQQAIAQVSGQHPEYAFECETLVSKPGLECDQSQPQAAKVIGLIESGKPDARRIGLNYYTDAAVLVPALDVPFLLFGPGNADQAHVANEKLELENLYQSCAIYQTILQRMAEEAF